MRWSLICAMVFCAETCEAGKLLSPGRSVRALAFSGDGKYLAATSSEPEEPGLATVWELPAGKVSFSHKEPKGMPATAFSPDGKWLVLGSFTENAIVVSTATWTIDRRLPGHGKAARGLAFSHDSATLAVSSYDGFIQLWDVATWMVKKTLENVHEEWVYSVAFSKDGKTLASGGRDNKAKLWDVETGKNLHAFEHGGIVRRVLFTPDDGHLINTSWDGTLSVRERDSGKLLASLDRYGSGDDAAITRDGKLLAIVSHEVRIMPLDLRAADAALLKKIGELMHGWDDDDIKVRERASEQITALGLPALAELSRVAKESADPEWRLRARMARSAIRSAPPAFKLRHPEGDVQSVAFAPDGKTLATGGVDGIVRLWNPSSGEETMLLRQFPATAARVPKGEY